MGLASQLAAAAAGATVSKYSSTSYSQPSHSTNQPSYLSSQPSYPSSQASYPTQYPSQAPSASATNYGTNPYATGSIASTHQPPPYGFNATPPNALVNQPPINSQYGQPNPTTNNTGYSQPGGYTGNQTGYGSTASSGQYSSAVYSKLCSAITGNRLEAFYPNDRLSAIANRAGSIDYAGLAARWQMPVEMALELVPLALYDIVVYADDSGSMRFAENGTRIDDLKEILAKVAEVATLFDDDGILIRFMNSNAVGNGVKTASEANNLVAGLSFDGLTPLGSALDTKVIRPMFFNNLNSLQKPILVISITDGEPSEDPSIIKRVITEANNAAARSRYGSGAIAFEFAQVGRNQKAQAFLASLDNDPRVGHIIDATSYYELEAEEFKRKGLNLTPSLWLIKLMVGAIDPDKDRRD